MTYRTLSGQKRPRRFLLAAGLILILLLILSAGAAFQRSSTRRNVFATPQALAAELPTLTATTAPTSVPPTPTPEPCPTEARQWQLGDLMPNNHLKIIKPVCVYDSLEPILVWHLMTRRGYTGEEAAQLLDFDTIPVGDRRDRIGGLTSTGDPQQIPLTHDALHPDYALWQVDAAGQPLTQIYSLRGCYRPFRVVGGQIEDWGTGYDLICTFALDHPAGWAVMQMADLTFSGEMPAYRQFYLFGYADRQWKMIGSFKGLDTSMDDPARFEQDRADYAAHTNWDSAQLEVNWPATPLRSNWQTHHDPAILQQIIAHLERVP